MHAKTGCEHMKEMSCPGWSKASGFNGFTRCDIPLFKCLTISNDTFDEKKEVYSDQEDCFIRLFKTCINPIALK